MKTGFSELNKTRISRLTDQQLILEDKLKKAKKDGNVPEIKKIQFHLKETSKGHDRIRGFV